MRRRGVRAHLLQSTSVTVTVGALTVGVAVAGVCAAATYRAPGRGSTLSAVGVLEPAAPSTPALAATTPRATSGPAPRRPGTAAVARRSRPSAAVVSQSPTANPSSVTAPSPSALVTGAAPLPPSVAASPSPSPAGPPPGGVTIVIRNATHAAVDVTMTAAGTRRGFHVVVAAGHQVSESYVLDPVTGQGGGNNGINVAPAPNPYGCGIGSDGPYGMTSGHSYPLEVSGDCHAGGSGITVRLNGMVV